MPKKPSSPSAPVPGVPGVQIVPERSLDEQGSDPPDRGLSREFPFTADPEEV